MYKSHYTTFKERIYLKYIKCNSRQSSELWQCKFKHLW